MKYRALAFLTQTWMVFVVGMIAGGAIAGLSICYLGKVDWAWVLPVDVLIAMPLGCLSTLWRLKYLKEVKDES